jgi:hypothetical protein
MTASSNKTLSEEENFFGYSENTSYVFPPSQGLGEITNQLTHKPTKAITRTDLLYKRGIISISCEIPRPSMWHPSENDGWRRETSGICLYSDRIAPEARSGHLVPS